MLRFMFTLTLSVALATGSKIAIKSKPDFMLQDLTQSLTIRCSLLDTDTATSVGKRATSDLTETQYDVQSVKSICVVRNSINEPVANLTSQQNAAVPLTDLNTLKTPYDRPPMVSLGIDLLDESSDAYLRIHTDVDNLTKDGFTVRCGTWADTYIFKVRVRWVSVVA